MRWRQRLLGALAAVAVAALLGFGGWKLWSSPWGIARRADHHLTQARAHLAAHELPQARAGFYAALRLDPAGAEARKALAGIDLDRGDWEPAFVELQALTEMHPSDPEGWIRLARIMIGRGWIEAPEAALERGLEGDPKRADAHALRAELRFRLGRYHGARMDAEAALASAAAGSEPEKLARATLGRIAARTSGKSGDGPVPPRHLRADAQIDVGSLSSWSREEWPGRMGDLRGQLEAPAREQRWADAQAVVDRARQLFPDGIFAPYLDGILAYARGDLDRAERELDDARALAPRNPTLLAVLARVWAHRKEQTFAGDRLMKVAQADPPFAFARYLAARAYIEARDPGGAETALRRGLTLQPDSPVPYQHLADFYYGLDRASDAIDIGAQGMDRFPHAMALRMVVAQISSAMGRAQDAIRAYDSVLADRPDQDIVEYRLGMLLASQEGDPAARQRAARIWSDLRADTPSDPLLADVLGWLDFRVGEGRKARQILEGVIQVAPHEPRPHFHLAAVYARERKPDRARAELEAALASGRPFPERLEAMRLLRETQPGSAARAPSGRER